MLYLYLARHGETFWNTQNRMQGRQDSPLTEKGLAQAVELARQLSDVPLDRAWSSPALRAVRTAQEVLALQARAVPLTVDERIHEMALGALEGVAVHDANAADPINMHAFFHQPELFQPLGDGETFAAVSARMADFLAEMTALALDCAKAGRDCHMLVISHNITLKALFALMENRPLTMLRDGPPIRQATLYRAQLNDGAWVIGASGPIGAKI